METSETRMIDLIVVALANDYEPLGVLQDDVRQAAQEANLAFSEIAFSRAVRRSVEEDLIEPIRYNQTSGRFERQGFTASEVTEELKHELLFRLTDRGEQRLTQLGC